MRYLLFILALAIQFTSMHAGEHPGFTVQTDVAQYGGSTYSNVVLAARGITLELAFAMAESNPDIDYFFYTKGYRMVLVVPRDVPVDPSDDPFGLISEVNFRYDSGSPGFGYCRVFNQGDAVFFKADGLWLGSAPGLADTYFKE